MNRMFFLRPLVLGLLWLGSVSLVQADSVCIDAARRAARDAGLPEDVLIALSRVETGRGASRTPWPWALNHRGTAHYPDSRAAALTQVRAWLAAGETSFDVGCFQINMRWHGEHFSTLEQMIDPQRNADYAARFLGQLYAETGSWETSIGYYHSRSPDLARAYRQRVLALIDTPPPAPRRAPTPAPRAGRTWRAMPDRGQTRRGSLFPLS